MRADEFRGKRVLITNAMAGIGPTLAQSFCEAGASVELVDIARGLSVDAEVPDIGTATYLDDVLDSAEAVSSFFSRYGELDVFIHVSPPVRRLDPLDADGGVVTSLLTESLVLPMLCLGSAAKPMVHRGSGRIMSFVSMSGKTGVHDGVAFSASASAGVIAFSRSLATDLAATGVTVNTIATALFRPNTDLIAQERRGELINGIPVGRFGEPNEAAHAAFFLASQDAAFVTGETLNLSGGRFMD